MLRITELIRDTLAGKPLRRFDGVILIWNLTNACNLSCAHCYAAANTNRAGEMPTDKALSLIPELAEAGVRIGILSGGEPLIREDVFEIADGLRAHGILPYLSTNGTLVRERLIEPIISHFRYVGISIDGAPEVHDRFRGRKGAYEQSMTAIRLLRDAGVKVGMRFTITPETRPSLPYVFDLLEQERLPKLYLSHLVYAGRGDALDDLQKTEYRETVQWVLDRAFDAVERGLALDLVSGNNEADAVLLHREFARRYPDKADDLLARLTLWGGNQAGVRLANIDYRGNVKADPFYADTFGNVHEQPFTEIWQSNGLLSQLREQPRPLGGRCAECPDLPICNGGSRARAFAVYGDYMAEDPACYL